MMTANDLINTLCGFPGTRKVSAPLKILKATLLQTDGWMHVNGVQYTIKSERQCPGIYRVWLEAH